MFHLTFLMFFQYKTLSQCDYNKTDYPFYSECKHSEFFDSCSFKCLPEYSVNSAYSNNRFITCETNETCLSYCYTQSPSTYQDYPLFCTYAIEDKTIALLYDQYEFNKEVCTVDVSSYPNNQFGNLIYPNILKAHFISYSCKKGHYLDNNNYELSATCNAENSDFVIVPCTEACAKPKIPNAVFVGENPEYILKPNYYTITCQTNKVFSDDINGGVAQKILQCNGVDDLSNYPIACIQPDVPLCDSVIVRGNPDYDIPDRARSGQKYKNGHGLEAPEFFSWRENEQVNYDFILCNSKEEIVTLFLYKVICPLIKINGKADKIEYSRQTDPESFNLRNNEFSGNVTITGLDGFTVNGKKSLTFSCSYDRNNVPKAEPPEVNVFAYHCPIPVMYNGYFVEIEGRKKYINGETTILIPDYVFEKNHPIKDNQIKVHCVSPNVANIDTLTFERKKCVVDENEYNAHYRIDCYDKEKKEISGICQFNCNPGYFNQDENETICHRNGTIINPPYCVLNTCEKKNVPENYHGFWSGECKSSNQINFQCEYKCDENFHFKNITTFNLKCKFKRNNVIAPEPIKCERKEANFDLIIIITSTFVFLIALGIGAYLFKPELKLCFKKRK